MTAEQKAAAPGRAIITGAARGLGLETARQLARQGWRVILADRDAVAGEAAAQQIRRDGGRAEFRLLDLADLSAIREFADRECSGGQSLELLINNAGILPPMQRAETRDGFELEFGIAHLGHYALTGLLLPQLLHAPAARVVSISSISHPGGHLDFDDLAFQRRYNGTRTYAATKLACLLFAQELQRQAQAHGNPLLSVAAHPGVARTALADGWQGEQRRGLRLRAELLAYHLFIRLFGRSAAQGAVPLVHAATHPQVTGGGYYGPCGWGQVYGPPGPVRPAPKALDPEMAARLWEASEWLTGVRYDWGTALEA